MCFTPLSRALRHGGNGEFFLSHHINNDEGRGRPGQVGVGVAGTHRPVFERLQDLTPQLSVALVLLDEAALLGREAVGLDLTLLRCPSRGPSASPATCRDRTEGVRAGRWAAGPARGEAARRDTHLRTWSCACPSWGT